MNVIRASYFTSVVICLPLLVYTWGIIDHPDVDTNTIATIQQSLHLLWCLQLSTLLLLSTWFITEHSASDCVLANLMIILLPMPFMCLAWLAAAVTGFGLIKFTFAMLSLSILAIGFGLLCKRYLSAIRIDLFISLLAIATVWITRVVWLNWFQ